MRIKSIVAPLLLALFSGALLVQLPLAIAERAADYDLFEPVKDVRNILVENFADPDRIDDDKMRIGMIEGMIETLGDDHTMYIPPADLPEFEKELRGTYVGIGCEVNIIDDYLTIISPMDGSPALEAGIMAGDVVLEIEGQSTLKMPIEECIKRLMGEAGTTVAIKVRHVDGSEQNYTLKRGRISTRTVKGIRREGDNWNYCIDQQLGLSYIRVTQFNQTTIDEFTETLGRIQGPGLNGLVLDLRDNPGGELGAAVEMVDLFLTEGTIVSVRPRPEKGQAEVHHAKRGGTMPDFPIIVLINGQSASASEIVAGALQHHRRAKIMGSRSFGKGSVQEVRELEFNQGTLKFSSAHYYLPSGRNINRSTDSLVWGVDPDPGMVVQATADVRAMFLARREFEIIRPPHARLPACADPRWIRDQLKDEVLATAIETLSAAVRTGNWPAAGEGDSTIAAFDQELGRHLQQRADLLEALSGIEARISQLQNLAATAGKPPLLPPDVDLLQGTLAVRDRHGNLIGSYTIEGGDVELALESLKLEPIVEGK